MSVHNAEAAAFRVAAVAIHWLAVQWESHPKIAAKLRTLGDEMSEREKKAKAAGAGR
jgi:hypothetical protein